MNPHDFDRGKGAPPATDAVQVFLNRSAFPRFPRIPICRDLGFDLDGKHRLAPGLTLKAKGFYHTHVDGYESYRGQAYEERIAVRRCDDALAGGSLLGEWEAAEWSTLRLAAHLKDDTHRERDDACIPFAESSSTTGSVGLGDSLTLSKGLSAVAGVSRDWFDVSSARRNVTDGTTGDFVRQNPLAPGQSREPALPVARPEGLEVGQGQRPARSRRDRLPTGPRPERGEDEEGSRRHPAETGQGDPRRATCPASPRSRAAVAGHGALGGHRHRGECPGSVTPPSRIPREKPLATKEMLVTALHAFEGTMLFVSHDRTFLRGLANRVLEIGGEDGTGKPVTYGGSYEEYVARSGHEAPGVHA